MILEYDKYEESSTYTKETQEKHDVPIVKFVKTWQKNTKENGKGEKRKQNWNRAIDEKDSIDRTKKVSDNAKWKKIFIEDYGWNLFNLSKHN